jgi:CDP-paratose 2-epimerase
LRILITGGAGFVGSSLALAFKRTGAAAEVVAFDNLKRRGAEYNLPTFRRHGIEFVHGDVRTPSDLDEVAGAFDVVIDASAEPSVLAGLNGSPRYVVDTNLVGTVNCLEFARKRGAAVIFLSTSRVYSIAPLREVVLTEEPTRFQIAADQLLPGVGPEGVREEFPTHLPRSFYGASKLASELLVQEYVHSYGMKAVINRCGVLAGPGQFGKVDQGVFTLWVANHVFGKPLKYTGFGGTGKQVRDLLHPLDLYDLIVRELSQLDAVSGRVLNVGGGKKVSTSMLELTALCREETGMEVAVASDPATNPVDIPLYVSDASQARRLLGWEPSRDARTIVRDIAAWIRDNRETLTPVFG